MFPQPFSFIFFLIQPFFVLYEGRFDIKIVNVVALDNAISCEKPPFFYRLSTIAI